MQRKCETLGAAGFFAVAMYYRGAADGFYKPLCPGVITPNHYVQEDVGYSFEGVHQGRAELRRRLGLVSRAFHGRSRTFLGGLFTGLIGSLATAPLVARVLFPHLTARIRRRFGSLQMANDWRVRVKVAALGVEIPDDTFFVGAYHNNRCDDSVVSTRVLKGPSKSIRFSLWLY